jgi:Predicted periplasmic ligand-binding sensor domain
MLSTGFGASSALDAEFVAEISPGITPINYPSFDSGTGAVNATALQSDGKILAGGNVSRYKTSGDLTALKRLLPSGALDTSFNSGGAGLAASGGQPEVNALLVDSSDRIYVGGTFSSYNGSARSGILRLHADGTLDDDYAPAGLGGANRYAQTLALQPDGKLLVGGSYSSINGNGRSHLARLNADGTLDFTFTAFAAFSSTFTAAVRDIALLPDGRILVGGVSNTSRPVFIRLLANGALDPTFAPGLVNSTGSVSKLLLLPDGRALAAGFFTLSDTGQEVDLAAFHADGALDTAFLANLGAGPNGSVLDLALQPDGTVLASGVFNLWGDQPRASLARLSLTGELLSEPAPLPYTDNRDNPNVTPFYLTHIYSLSVQPDGKLVAGGWFSRITDPDLETYNLTRFVNAYSASSPGAIRLLSATATTAENAGSLTLQVSRFGGTTGAVSVQFATSTGGANGTATAGSDYTTTNGTLSWAAGEAGFKTITIPILQDTAAESPETFTVTLSNPTGGATIPAANAKTVVTLRDDDSAPIVTRPPAPATLEQGSGFTLSVRYDSVLPVTIQWQRDPDGSGPLPFADLPGATEQSYSVLNAAPDTHAGSYRAVLTSSAGTTHSASAAVSISVPAGSVVLTGFTSNLTAPLTKALPLGDGRYLAVTNTGLVRIKADGTADTAFPAVVFNSSTSDLVLETDGKIVVSGFFTSVTVDGAATSRTGVARFHADGTLDTGFNLNLTHSVQALATGAGGKLYVGGTSGGGFKRFTSAGVLDTTFGTNGVATNIGTGIPNGYVWAVQELADGRILVSHQNGSGFSSTYHFHRLAADGSLDPTFTPPALQWYVNGWDLLPDGRIAVAGRFNTIAGRSAARIAILNTDGTFDPAFLRPAAEGPNAPIRGVRYQNGRLLVWGEFTDAGGLTPRGLARFNLDGSLDSTFSVGAGANSNVNSLHLTPDGDYDIFGSFTQFKGVARAYAARLVGNAHIGAIGFAPARVSALESAGPLTLTLRRYGAAAEPVSIAWATADATATAGSDYVAASGVVSWLADDIDDKTITIELLEDAAIESGETFRVVLGAATGPANAAASATVELIDNDTPVAFTTQPAGPASALFSGDTLTLSAATVASPTPVAYQWFLNGVAIPGANSASYTKPALSVAEAGLYTLVATNAAGPVSSTALHVVVQPRPGRVAPGQVASGRPSFVNGVQTVSPLPDGGALIGGFFNANASSNIPNDYLIRVRPDGSADTGFTPALNNTVAALLAQPDGKILVAGSFTTVNGATQRYLYRLNVDLTPDTAFNSAVATAINTSWGQPTDLALDSTGRVYLSFNNFSSGGSIWRFSSAGVLDEAYTVSASGGGVTTLAIQADDRLVVGGTFTSINRFGQTMVAKYRVARLGADGLTDAGFTASQGNMTINDLVVAPSGRLFVVGGTGSGTSILEISGDTGATVRSTLGGAQVYEAAVGPDGRFAGARAGVGGSGSVFRLNIPADATASADSTFNVGTGPNQPAVSLAYAADGSLWIAGTFTTFDGFASGGVVKLQGSAGDPGIVNQPVRADVNPGATARFAVGATGTNLGYRWLKNGEPLSDDARIGGSTTAVLAIAGVTASDDANYSVEVTGGAPETTVTSAPAKLNVLGAPAVAVSPASATPALGSTITLAADVLAATPATYVWKRDGVTIADGGRYSGATTGALVITGVNATDNGAYTLTVTNAHGSASTTPATVTADAYVAGALDPATAWVRALNTSTQLNAILHLPDGRTLVGGTASSAGGGVLDSAGTSISSGLVLVDAQGNLSSTPAGSFARQVNVVRPLPDGKFLVAGSFSAVNGGSAVSAVRLNADLTRDNTFTPVSTNITFVAAHGDAQGRVYLGGSFNNYNGQTGHNHLVRLKPDGSLDPDFNAVLNGAVASIVSLPDGRFYVGGAFSTHSPSALPVPGLLRFLADGRVDPSFSAASLTIGTPNALAVDAQGRVIVGTAFGIRRLLPDGSLDDTFSTTVSVNNGVRALAALPDGKILVGGFFTSPTNRFFRLNADGTRDTAFDVGTGFTHTSGSNIAVTSIAPDSLGRVWLGGHGFTAYKGVASSALGFAVLQSEAPATFAFTRLPTAAHLNFGDTVTFAAAATGNNGFTWQWLKNGAPLSDGPGVSGAKTATLTLSGLAAANAGDYSVRITGPGGVSLTSPASPLAVGPIVAPPVITASPSDATRDLGASVTFTGAAKGALPLAFQWFHFDTPLSDGTQDGVTISGATSHALTIGGLTFAQAGEYRLRVTNPDGTDTTDTALLTVERRPGGLAAGPVGAIIPNSGVNALLRLSDGSMLVGGSFTNISVNGVSHSRGRLARFLPDGTIDPAFAPSFPSSVNALAQDSAGRVFVAGTFSGSVTVGGVTANRIRVARLTPALALDTAFDTSVAGPNATINALAPTENGGVYVGGLHGFNKVGDATVNRIARLNASGALDTGFTAATSVNNEVKVLLRRSDGKLYAGGTFGTQLLNANGSRDTAFAPEGFIVQGQAMLPLPDGSLVVGANPSYLKRLNANTGATLSDYTTGHFSQVTALARQADGKLLSGSAGVLKRTNLETQTDDTGFSAFNASINALAVDGAGRIWVGGSFYQYGGASVSSLVVLNGGEYESRNGHLASQTLTFPAIPDRTFGDTNNTLALSAASSAGLAPITFSVTDGPATVSGNTLTITGAGTITVQAAQAGDATYAAATATRTFTVAKAAQTISFADPADRTITSPDFELSATASSGLPVSFAVSGVATLGGDGKTVALTGSTGTVTVTAKQAGNDNYLAAPDVVHTFEVTTGTAQTITFNALANRVANAKPFTISATATSGLPVSFAAVSGPATISGNTVILTGAPGTVTIRATQEGGEKGGVTYAAAPPIDQSFEVTAAPPTKTQKITFTAPAKATYGDAPLTLSATANSGLSVAFEVVSGPATLAGDTLTFTGAGKVVVKATQPGDGTYKPAAAVNRTITVAKAVLTVNFTDVTRLVRAPNPALTIESYDGFVGSDNATSVATPPTGATKAALNSAEGVYPITLKGGVSANYTFKMGTGSVTVVGFSGAYEALLVDNAGTPLGKLELLVPKNALSFTGTLNLASEPAAIALRGNLSASDGSSATGVWTRNANSTKGIAALSLGFELADDVLDGELSRDSEDYLSIGSGTRLFVQALDAKKKKLPSPWTGAHTLVLRDPIALVEIDTRPLPLGAGHASGTIAATGVLTLKGKLADGSALTGSAKADQDGHYRVFVRPYAKRLDSALSGELALVAHPDQTRFSGRYHAAAADGRLFWSKAALPESTPAKKQDKSYRQGFAAELITQLDPWLAPNTKAATVNGVTIPAGTLVQRLGLGNSATSTSEVDLTFALPDDLDFGARSDFLPDSLDLSAKGVFSVPPPLPAKADNPAFSLKVTPGTGAFSGAFTLSDIPTGKTKAVTRKVTISGTLRQGPDGTATLGHGYFLLDPSVDDSDTEQVSGELILEASTAP